MRNLELIELAAFASLHAPRLLSRGHALSAASVEQYWAASKCRIDRWNRALARVNTRVAAPRQGGRAAHPVGMACLAEEVLAGEVLTRVWSAVLAASDRLSQAGPFEPLGESVFLAHLESRQRVLRALMHSPNITVERAVALNELRRRADRWTDLLVAPLWHLADVSRYAANAQRAGEFARDALARAGDAQPPARTTRSAAGGAPAADAAWLAAGRLSRTALRHAFDSALVAPSLNHDLNLRIAEAVVSGFPAELVESTGVFRSLWLHRLTNAAQDAESLLAALTRH